MVDRPSTDLSGTLSAPPRPPTISSGDATAVEASDGTQRRFRLFYLVSFLFWCAIGLRTVIDVSPVTGVSERLALGALVIYLLLLASERALTRRVDWYPSLYFALQTGMVLSLFLFLADPELDYFAILYIPLTAQVMLFLQRPVRYRWIVVFALAMVVGLVNALGWAASLPFILLYAVSYFFVASYAALLTRAEAAREQSRLLLSDLRVAYQRLETFAAQAEQLAVVEERNRLARDLHDSVTQTLFGLTLSAEAASRALALGQTDTTAAQMREIGETARQALAELRLLVFALRPSLVAEEGLCVSLQARLAAVEGRAGLATDLSVEGDTRLPAAIEAEFDRIAQEALNNALKHARARRIAVHLRQDGPTASLAVTDDGVGFDPADSSSRGGLGLRGMTERAARIGGTLAVASQPGAGTRVQVEVPR